MDWTAEFCQEFRQVRSGGPAARVSFAERSDLVGELGRAFNALAAELASAGSAPRTREQTHDLRNQLAGILAALHVLAGDGSLSAEQQARLDEVVQEARRLDAGLHAGTEQ